MTSATVEISKKEYEGMKDTIQVLQDSEAVEAIEKGLEQIEKGRTRSWKDVKEDMDL